MSTAFRLGIFVFLGLLFLSVGVFLIGNKEFLFGDGYHLKAEFENVGGLDNGADVRIGGIHQGTVKEIDLPSQPNGKVTVVMNLRSSTRSVVRSDSRASIKTEGMLGDKYVEISFGSENAAVVPNDGTIASETPTDLSQQAHVIAGEAETGVAAFRDDMEALQHNFFLRGFFKRRGYFDSSELTAHAATHLPAGAPIKQFAFDPAQIFAKPDNAQLKDKGDLNDAGMFLQKNKFGVAIVESSEPKGGNAQQRLLTEARAKVVRDYLSQSFKLDDSRVETMTLTKGSAAETSRIVVLVYSPSPSQASAEQSSSPNLAANVKP